jgi:hypothetical protein
MLCTVEEQRKEPIFELFYGECVTFNRQDGTKIISSLVARQRAKIIYNN